MAKQDPRVITRPGLVRRLVDAPGRGVVTLIAPAGYGKTTLIDAWSAVSQVRLAICSLASIHDSQEALGLYLAEAIGRHVPPVADLARDAALPDADWQRVLLPRLVRALGRVHLAIVLDDVHVITDRRALGLLSTLIAVLPPHVTLVLAGRSLPDLALGKVAIEGRLVEISAQSLELTLEELRALRRLGLKEEGLVRVFNATGGWPAGVRMELMRLEAAKNGAASNGHHPTPDERSAGGPHSWVLGDYLDEEVLRPLAPQRLAFLKDLAVLTPIDPETLHRVRPTGDTKELLRSLRVDPVPMVSLRETATGATVVMHPLMAEHLAQWHPLPPEERRGLLVRAATEFERDNLDLAFEAVRRAGDIEALARFVYTKSTMTVLTGRTAVVRRWLSYFPEPLLRRFPQLAVTYVAICGTEGDNGAAKHWLDLFGRWAGAPEAQMLSEENVDIATIFGHAISSGGATESWQAVTSNDTIWSAMITTLDGHKLALDGKWDEAEQVLRTAISSQSDLGINDIWRLSALAYVHEQQGRPDLADDCARRCEEVLTRWGLHQHANTYCAHVSMAAAAQRRGDTDQATALIRSGLLKITQTRGREYSKVTAYLGLARVALAFDAFSLANTCVREARALMAAAGEPPVLRAQLDDIARRHPLAIDPDRSLGDDHGLSSAELRVLQFLGSFLPVPQIAAELTVSPATVRTHIRAIYRKLGVHDRVGAVTAAREVGLIN